MSVEEGWSGPWQMYFRKKLKGHSGRVPVLRHKEPGRTRFFPTIAREG